MYHDEQHFFNDPNRHRYIIRELLTYRTYTNLSMNENPSFNWEKLQDTYYRNRELTSLEWPTLIQNLTNGDDQASMIFCISSCFIAIATEENIELYDYKGNSVNSIQLRLLGKSNLLNIKFKDKLGKQLIVIMEDSIQLIENWDRLDVKAIPLPDDVLDTIWDYKENIIILKSSQDIWRANWDNLSLELLYKNNNKNLKNLNDGESRSGYRLLTKYHWDTFKGEMVILLDVNSVFQYDCQKKELIHYKNLHEWHKIVISSDGMVCLFNYKFNKFQIYKDLALNCLTEITLDDNQISPRALKWLPNNLIALVFSDEIKIYANNGSYITFWYPDEIVCAESEIDGLKVINMSGVNLVTEVTKSTVGIFKIGSTEPGAMLLDSWKLVSEHQAKAIERLSNFNLRQAVEDCIDATKDEFDPQIQKMLLNAVVFGKNSLPFKSYDSTEFVKTCDLVRLLNTLRNINIFLSEQEYQYYGLYQIVDILLIMRKYAEVIEIIKMTGEKTLYTSLFLNWSSSKIKLSSDLEDGELLKVIESQLKELPEGVKAPMAKISKVALVEGRYKLCRDLSLLDNDPISKIMTLYSLDDDSIAIKEALNTNNPELVISLLLKLKEKLTPAQLSKLLILDTSDDQLYSYFNRHNLNFLMDFYTQTDKFLDLSYCIIEQGRQQGAINAILPQVIELFDKFAKRSSSMRHNSAIFSRELQLNNFQESLTNIFNRDFMHYTLDETLSKLIEMQQDKYVKELLKTFKITERKFYHIKCKVLVERELFDELSQLATAKKSPIGYRIFYRRLMDKGHKREASLYIDMIPNLSTQERQRMVQQCQSEADS